MTLALALRGGDELGIQARSAADVSPGCTLRDMRDAPVEPTSTSAFGFVPEICPWE
jgi:hypothetical protein